MHGILPHEPSYYAHWRDKTIIDDPQNDSGVDCPENMSDLHPSIMDLLQALGRGQTKNYQRTAQDQ
jgi:hypothetical protein